MDSLKILSPTYRLTLTTSASNALQLVRKPLRGARRTALACQ